jgi:hypothetical protein
MPKHKHADLIIAWANGAKIQVKNGLGDWIDVGSPTWSGQAEYRIKPERVWPVTSFTESNLKSMQLMGASLTVIANAAINRYIEDNEKCPNPAPY